MALNLPHKMKSKLHARRNLIVPLHIFRLPLLEALRSLSLCTGAWHATLWHIQTLWHSRHFAAQTCFNLCRSTDIHAVLLWFTLQTQQWRSNENVLLERYRTFSSANKDLVIEASFSVAHSNNTGKWVTSKIAIVPLKSDMTFFVIWVFCVI